MANDRAGPGMADATGQPTDFVDQVMRMVQAIPPGHVMTYGDIATLLTARAERAGLAEAYGPRMVGFVMSRFGGTLPWWRVIRSTGHPPRHHQAQARPFYLEENTPLLGPADNYRIDLRRARFHPDPPDDLWRQGETRCGRCRDRRPRQPRPAGAHRTVAGRAGGVGSPRTAS